MNRRRNLGPSSARGFALVDLVVGLFLTAVGLSMIAWVVADATEHAVPGDTTRREAMLAVDALSRDLRESNRVEVVRIRRGEITSLDLVGGSAAVRWTIDNGRLLRQVLPSSTTREMVDGLRVGGGFELREADGSPIDPRDPVAVRDCTSLLLLAIAADSGDWTLERVSATRIDTGAAPCP